MQGSCNWLEESFAAPDGIVPLVWFASGLVIGIGVGAAANEVSQCASEPPAWSYCPAPLPVQCRDGRHGMSHSGSQEVPQTFICLRLRVMQGMAVVREMEKVSCDRDDFPVDPVVIVKVLR